MTERGKARYTVLSAGSNTTVKSSAGTLYGLNIRPANGTIVRAEDAIDLGATPDLNASGAATIEYLGTYSSSAPDSLSFGPGIGFNSGLTIAATSNARVGVVWE